MRIATNRPEKVCRRNHRPAAALLNKVEKGMQDRFLIRNRKIEVAAKRRPDAGARLYLANQYLNVMLRWHRTKRIKAANLRFVADQRSEAMRPVRMIRKPLGVIFFPTGLRAKDLGRGEAETGIARDGLALRCAIGEDALDRGDRLLDAVLDERLLDELIRRGFAQRARGRFASSPANHPNPWKRTSPSRWSRAAFSHSIPQPARVFHPW